MKRPHILTALLGGLVLCGCQEPNLAPSYGMGDPYPAPLNDPQISLLSPELRPWIAFHPAIVTDDGEVMAVIAAEGPEVDRPGVDPDAELGVALHGRGVGPQLYRRFDGGEQRTFPAGCEGDRAVRQRNRAGEGERRDREL